LAARFLGAVRFLATVFRFFGAADFFADLAFIVAPAACTAISVSSDVLLTIIPAVTPTVRAIVVSRCPVIVDPFFFGINFSKLLES
jgi:hypothetical protein